ncbi:NAD-dependent epimerase/dehydratase family protein [Pseudorhodoplanes sp.]|jgi:nucleoside-diphosphate-sugar epimerase|uniref:NAD-dependent epimerase/dehydratase family protein n=1 Tax=Pseudorhodoplanes sp. TaxID=1934341 RepID=UPI002C65C3C9|nr:NAD-dependent epimerase/dehydratase family protein [Pseudorhodoplanes sp.]HWV41641.1 NAD-dependent epimerase/dehydratase family protein [Pseudorhodoplanes sp.]
MAIARKETIKTSKTPMPWALVTGAGGFIGHHLVSYLKANGYRVRGVDIKRPEYGESDADEFLVLDLREAANCLAATSRMNVVYHLAADMGGIGYITGSHAEISRNNSLMNIHMLDAARQERVDSFLFSSSACVYRHDLQTSPDVTPLREEDAWPAEPEEGYGLEKLYMEKLCQYYREDYGLATRVVRFHNVYGPQGTYDGGREKAPAAMCRKVARAYSGDQITVWGDGKQTRSFMYVDDCVEGIYRIMQSGFVRPLNLGTDELVSVDELAKIVIDISGKALNLTHDRTKPQGVRGRNSDNTLLRRVLQWEPSTPLRKGLIPTYSWIASQVSQEKSRQPDFAGATAAVG